MARRNISRRSSPKQIRARAARRNPDRMTYGKVFMSGGKLVQYGYRGGKKVGLFLYKSAKTYNKAKYTAKAGYHAYRTIRKFTR
jgi:hypothetical protein